MSHQGPFSDADFPYFDVFYPPIDQGPFSILLNQISEVPPQPSLEPYIPSALITPLPDELPFKDVNDDTEEKDKVVTKGRKRKIKNDVDYQAEIEHYRNIAKDTKKDQAHFKKLEALILKSQSAQLSPAEASELRALKNMYSARLSRARNQHEKKSLAKNNIALQEENTRLMDENRSLNQRVLELETRLKLLEEKQLETLLQPQPVMRHYYVSLQRANVGNSAPSDTVAHAVRVQSFPVSSKPS